MTTNTDGLPGPEARVRAYLAAQAQEDARTGTTSDEIAWAVSDENGLVSLAIGDIRDAFAELAAYRDTVEAIQSTLGAGGSAFDMIRGIAAAL